jgi:DNA-directed RNA polymerase subunit RPC12/RpoP
MCRYAMSSYKPHYACFNCRKTFKRRLMADIQRGEGTKLEAKCPQCSELMASMGLDFESPKKTDIKKWEHLKSFYKVGITFHSCGCTGPGYIPNDKAHLISYFKCLKQDYLRELKFWRSRTEPVTEAEIQRELSKNWDFLRKIERGPKPREKVISNQEAINFWIGMIKEMEYKIELI